MMHHSRHTRAPGFSLVEAIISIAIIGVMFAAVMNTVGSAQGSRLLNADHARGRQLAADLLAEMLTQSYEDPRDTPLFGIEGSETNTTRADFDDIDDYHNWSASPPVNQNNTPVFGCDGWTRQVTVQWINPDDLSQTTDRESGVKRITIAVKHGEIPIASITVLRTDVWKVEYPEDSEVTINYPPNAVAFGSPTYTVPGTSVMFNANSSSDPEGDTLTYSWDFGDGQTASGVSVNHTYSDRGIWTATVTVTDSAGNSDMSVVVIHVQ